MTIEVLIHSDDTDGSTTFTDSKGNYTISSLGLAEHSTDQKKWFGSSIYLPQGSNRVWVDNFDWDNSTSNDHSWDFWFMCPNAAPGNGERLLRFVDLIYITYNSTTGNLQFYDKDNALEATLAWPFTQNTWHHVGLRFWNQNMYFFVDGVELVNGDFPVTDVDNALNDMMFGGDAIVVNSMEMYIDEICYHKDEAIEWDVVGIPDWPYETYQPPPTYANPSGEVAFTVGGSVGMQAGTGFTLANNVPISVKGEFTIGHNLLNGVITFPINGAINLITNDTVDLAGKVNFNVSGSVGVNSGKFLRLSGAVNFPVSGDIGVTVDDSLGINGVVTFNVEGNIGLVAVSDAELAGSFEFPVDGNINFAGCTSLPGYVRSAI